MAVGSEYAERAQRQSLFIVGEFFVSEDQDMEKIDRPLNFSHSFTI